MKNISWHEEEWEVSNAHRASPEEDGKVLEVGRGDGLTTV